MSNPIDALDTWLRTDFVRINTALENAYFAERVDVIRDRPDLEALKLELLGGASPLMHDLAALPSLPENPRASYRLLGLVGHYLAACQRHEAPLSAEQGARDAAWSISLRIGAALNVVPRFVFAHQALFNEATGGVFRTFTSLPDEEIFIRYNALGVLAYERAAHALRGLADIGVSSAVASYLFDQAEAALLEVLAFNQEVSRQLNVDRFFFNIRPYFKTYCVADREYRGANAGDFAAINEVDVALGMCSMTDPFYERIVNEKIGHVPPDDRAALQTLGQRPSLPELFERELDAFGASPAWKDNAARFLRVCKAHGAAYAHHHHRLVKAYVEAPARSLESRHSAGVTSSGPELSEVMTMLQRLLELRTLRGVGSGTPAARAVAKIQEALQEV